MPNLVLNPNDSACVRDAFLHVAQMAEMVELERLQHGRIQQTETWFTLLKPKVFPDGNQWCVLYGDNLQEGVCGFGNTPALAVEDFNKNFDSQRVGGVRA